jgi:hypothetical protein
VTPCGEGTIPVLVAAAAATDVAGHASVASNQLDFIYNIGPPAVVPKRESPSAQWRWPLGGRLRQASDGQPGDEETDKAGAGGTFAYEPGSVAARG